MLAEASLVLENDIRESTGAPSIRLLVVDAHPIVRWALTQIAEQTLDLTITGEAETAIDALNMVFGLGPNVVTIDCSLGDGQGWQLADELRSRYPDLGIVILAASESDELLLRALHLGASAFVAKSAPVQEVVAAIRHAAVAASSFSAAGLAQALRRGRGSEQTTLSRRETEVLALLREGHSVPEVAAMLYVSLSTAKTYVARLYEKLGANNRAQALMSAVKLGLFDEPVVVSLAG